MLQRFVNAPRTYTTGGRWNLSYNGVNLPLILGAFAPDFGCPFIAKLLLLRIYHI
jgi:hypothetical protein